MSGANNRTSAIFGSGKQRWVALAHRQPLLLLATAGSAGILSAALFGRWSVTAWLALLLAWFLSISFAPRRIRWCCTAAVFLPFMALRYLHDQVGFENASILAVAGPLDQPSVMEGIVDAPVTLRRHPLADQLARRGGSPWQSQLELSVRRFRFGQDFQPLDGRVLVVCDGKLDQLRPGDCVRVFGSLRQFAPPSNPGQRDLRQVYRRRRLHARVDVDTADQIQLLESGFQHRWRPVASIAAVSRDVLLNHTSESSGPLAVALVIGQRDFVDHHTRDLLLVTGTAHLLSVSGMHLAIVVVLAGWLATMMRISPASKIAWVIAICLLYTAITGARPPVVRAAVLVCTLMASMWIRRPIQPFNTLALAALLLTLYNPTEVFSVGMQLSFLAVMTLLTCGRRDQHGWSSVEQTLAREQRLQSLIDQSYPWPRRGWRYARHTVGQMIWFSLCVTAVSTPLIWHQFHVVSPVSVVTNVVLAPLLFVALGSGVATVIGGWLADPLAIVPGAICDLSLRAMRAVIQFAADVPCGHFWLPSPPTWMVVLFYAVLALSFGWQGRKLSTVLRRGWIAAWMSLAWWVSVQPAALPERTIEATFVDVGHGTSVVLRFDQNNVWLYDCGRLGNDLGSSRDIDATLWSLGVRRLQGIILSHADADHYNALPGVLRRFDVQQIVTPPGMLDESEGALAAARQAIKQWGVPVVELARGDRLKIGRTQVDVLHPPPQRVPGNDNANSLVLLVHHGKKTLLLPGDLEPPGTIALTDQRRPRPGGAAMAPHHGSISTDSQSVLQWARPDQIIVSGGLRAARPEVQQVL
ncbi:MAG: ComEC/Rec2 family competence protein, partial [Pirellulales bacterium]|nr:ComEC/Rec2 family competence protein [Pirellulales bacterium]